MTMLRDMRCAPDNNSLRIRIAGLPIWRGEKRLVVTAGEHVVALCVRASIPLTRPDDCFRRTTRFLHVYQFVLRQQDKAKSLLSVSLFELTHADDLSQPVFAWLITHIKHQTAILLFSPFMRKLIRVLNKNYVQYKFSRFFFSTNCYN